MSEPKTGADAGAKLRLALDMFDLGESIMREKLRRAHPGASEVEIEAGVWEWLSRRPGAEYGDTQGRLRIPSDE